MQLPYWIEFFEDLKNVRGRSNNTILAYRRDLELWADYRTNSSSVSGFFEFMKQHQLSTRSQARVISSLRTYLKFCEANGLEAPELRELRPPKVKASLPRPLTVREFDLLYGACETTEASKTFRNRLTLLMLFGLGCRVTELIEMSLQDFNPTERWLKAKGKGGKERLLPLNERLHEALLVYLQEHRTQLVKGETDSLLINDRGNRPSRVDIWRWLAAWSTKAGFEETIGPHRFRHGCATSLLEAGTDLRSIQMLLGHSSIQTTQIYTTVTQKTIRDTIDQHHPFSELSSLDFVEESKTGDSIPNPALENNSGS